MSDSPPPQDESDSTATPPPEVDEELVELLVASFPQATNAECRRFLKARDNSLERATDQLKDYTEWLELHEIVQDNDDDKQGVSSDDDAALWARVARKATLFETDEELELPRAVRAHNDNKSGCAKDGTVIIQVLPALIDLDIAPATTYALAITLYVIEKMNRDSLDKATVMLDVRAGTGFPNPSAYTLYPFIKAVASSLNTYAPERLVRCMLYPLPTVSLYLWEGIKPFLDADTTSKIVLMGGSAGEDSPPPEQEILEFIDEQVLDTLEDARKQEFGEPKAKSGWW